MNSTSHRTNSPPWGGPRATVNVEAIVKNWQHLSQLSLPAHCGAVIKANAYGLGVEQIIPTLWKAGCRIFFVSHVAEGIVARLLLPEDSRIVVLNGLFPGTASACIQHRLEPILASTEEIKDWAQASQGHHPCGFQVDIGMSRLGLDLKEAEALSQQQNLLASCNSKILIGHLAISEISNHPMNGLQLSRFQYIRSLFPQHEASLTNSDGIFLGKDYLFDITRPGIALYGGGYNPILPVLNVKSPILQVRTACKGENVGYGADFCLKRESRLAVTAYGYADGLHRRLWRGNISEPVVFIHDCPAPIIGRISMDLSVLDVTSIPNVCRGDWAEWIGLNLPLSKVAKSMGTIDREVLTSLGQRIQFFYTFPPN